MFAAGCLPTFSPHFLETNGLFISCQYFGAADSGHFPHASVLREAETPNNFFYIRPNTTGFLLYSTNTITFLKNEIPFNVVLNPVANTLEVGGALSENNCPPSVAGGKNVLTVGKQEPAFLRVIKFLQQKDDTELQLLRTWICRDYARSLLLSPLLQRQQR